MAQNYGLGRGLSSLIPQKKATIGYGNNIGAKKINKKISEPKEDFNYFSQTNNSLQVKTEEKEKTIKNVSSGVNEVDIKEISPNPYQPRTVFNETKLLELAESIKEHGIIQPIIVIGKDGKYEIIAGERRFQAAKIAGLSKVPVIIEKDKSNQKKLELAIVENVQRQDLNPIEEAKSYQRLMEEFDLGQEEVAKKVGKNRSVVANKLRFLKLPIEIQRSLIEGKITEGHAKAILALENPEKQRALYEMIIKLKLTVRQTEEKTKEISVRPHKRKLNVDPLVKQTEEQLFQLLGTKVKIQKSGQGGKIIIDYYSQEELNNIVSKFQTN